MKQLFLDSNEAFELYIIALRTLGACKKEVELDYKFGFDKKTCEIDEHRLKVAKKLLDFSRETTGCYLITEIENPF